MAASRVIANVVGHTVKKNSTPAMSPPAAATRLLLPQSLPQVETPQGTPPSVRASSHSRSGNRTCAGWHAWRRGGCQLSIHGFHVAQRSSGHSERMMSDGSRTRKTTRTIENYHNPAAKHQNADIAHGGTDEKLEDVRKVQREYTNHQGGGYARTPGTERRRQEHHRRLPSSNRDQLDIKQASTVEQLVHVIGVRKTFVAEDIAQAFQALKLLCRRRALESESSVQQAFELLSAHARQIQTYNPRQICFVLGAFGENARNPASLGMLKLLEAAINLSLRDFKSQDLANTLWSFAKAGECPSEELLSNLCNRIVETIESFNEQEISNIMWSFAKLNIRLENQLLEVIQNQVLCTGFDNFEPKGTSSLWWSFGKLGIVPKTELISDIVVALRKNIDAFHGQTASNILWAFAKLGVNPGYELLQLLGQQTCTKVVRINSQGISNVLWSFATLGVRPDDHMLRLLSTCIIDLAGSLQMEEVASIFWSFSKLNMAPSRELWSALDKQAMARIHEYTPWEIASLLHSIAKIASHPDLDEPIVSDTLLNELSKRAVATIGGFTAQGLANVMWSFATRGVVPENDLVQAVNNHAIEIIDTFRPRSVSVMVWSFSMLGLLPSHVLLEGLERVAVANMDGFNPKSAAMTCWAFEKFGWRLSDQLLNSWLQDDRMMSSIDGGAKMSHEQAR